MKDSPTKERQGGLLTTAGVGVAHELRPDWPVLSNLPITVTAKIPLPRFRIRDLMAIMPGQCILSDWPSTEDVPLKLGNVLLSWTEFEVVEERMAVRLTRLG